MRAFRFIFVWWRIEPEVRAEYFGDHLLVAAVTGVVWMSAPIAALALLQGGWRWSLGLTAAIWAGGVLYLYPAFKRAERRQSSTEREAS